MNFYYSESSNERLNTCHPSLRKVMRTALTTSPMDITVACGYRDQVEQNKAVKAGYSQLKFPLSRHNKYLSEAVDIWPCPLDWKNYSKKDDERFYILASYIKVVAYKLGIPIRWGGDYPTIFATNYTNGTIKRGKLDDMPHWELITKAEWFADLRKLLCN